MKKLDTLFQRKESILFDIQAELNATYDDWTALQKVITALYDHDSVSYQISYCGDTEEWLRFDELSDVPDRERDYLDTYLRKNHNLYINWNDCTLISCQCLRCCGTIREDVSACDYDEYLVLYEY